MTDQRRALLTEREREILAEEADVTDNYRYSVESRIRTRLQQRLGDDVAVLREYYPEIFDELVYPVVCAPADAGGSAEDTAEGESTAEGETPTPPDTAPSEDWSTGTYGDVNRTAVSYLRDADGWVSRRELLDAVDREYDLEITPDSWWKRHGRDAMKDAGAEFTRNKGWVLR